VGSVWVLGIIHSPTKRFLRNARRPRWLRPLGTPEKKKEKLSLVLRMTARNHSRQAGSAFVLSFPGSSAAHAHKPPGREKRKRQTNWQNRKAEFARACVLDQKITKAKYPNSKIA